MAEPKKIASDSMQTGPDPIDFGVSAPHGFADALFTITMLGRTHF
jgi:hypothetical protein